MLDKLNLDTPIMQKANSENILDGVWELSPLGYCLKKTKGLAYTGGKTDQQIIFRDSFAKWMV